MNLDQLCSWCKDWGWNVRAQVQIGKDFLCWDHIHQYVLDSYKNAAVTVSV